MYHIGSDTTDFSSTESLDVPVNTNSGPANQSTTNSSSSGRKELQPRRSLLDLMDSKDPTNTAITIGTNAGNSGGNSDSSMEKKETTVKKEEREVSVYKMYHHTIMYFILK